MSEGLIVADGVVLVTYVASRGGGQQGESLRSSLWCKGEDGWRVRFLRARPSGRAE